MRILVVEDNPANQLLAEAVLQREGFVVDVAGTAAEAVRHIAANLPDIILMDVSLPGQDGLSLTRDLKSDPATSRIPVVALTAHAMESDREAALAAGCAGHITKPIDVDKFADEVREFQAGPRGRRKAHRPGGGHCTLLAQTNYGHWARLGCCICIKAENPSVTFHSPPNPMQMTSGIRAAGTDEPGPASVCGCRITAGRQSALMSSRAGCLSARP
jgi:CheY-like chemotaxis protein